MKPKDLAGRLVPELHGIFVAAIAFSAALAFAANLSGAAETETQTRIRANSFLSVFSNGYAWDMLPQKADEFDKLGVKKGSELFIP